MSAPAHVPFRLLAVVVLIAAAAAGPASAQRAVPAPAADAQRARFLEMFARGYYPGRTGQLLIVPREGDIITRNDPTVRYMHGSPWPYDIEIPLFFSRPGIKAGVHDTPASQQDVAVTIATALGVVMPPTASGRVLPVLQVRGAPPRAVFLVVLDGMRPDYFERYKGEIPVISGVLAKSASFSRARINYLPTNTGVGHSTIVTGADPRVHGITGNNMYDRTKRARHDIMEGWEPRDLTALTIADVWQLETQGRAIIVAQGSSVPAATALGGHGACQLNGTRIAHAGYDEDTGFWKTNAECFAPLPPSVAALDARTLWPADGTWMGHKIDTPSGVRRSGLFPRFEADAFIGLLEPQPIGQDDVPDLLLLNFKGADYVGHKHGPHSRELAATLGEMDRHFARILAAVEAKVGKDYLLVVTADHGMPAEPAAKSGRRLATDIVADLHARFDPQGKTLISYYEPENAQLFVDLDRLKSLKLTLEDLAKFLESRPYLYAAFTQDEVRRATLKLPR